MPTASRMRFRSQEVYEKWRKEFFERLELFDDNIVSAAMGIEPVVMPVVAELQENMKAGKGIQMWFVETLHRYDPLKYPTVNPLSFS